MPTRSRNFFVGLIAALALVVLAACDPNSRLAELTEGGAVCEQAASAVAECCRNAELSNQHPEACAAFTGGLGFGLVELNQQCAAAGGQFGTGAGALDANAIGDMGCPAVLARLDEIFSQSGDGDSDVVDGDFIPIDGDDDVPADGDKPEDGDEPVDGDDEACATDGTPCDDLNPCTENDRCDAGICAGEQIDCSSFEDECNNSACVDGQCHALPVENGLDCGHVDPTCGTATCQSGICVAELKDAGEPCEDGNLCTDNDTCNATGQCESGAEKDCSELSNACNDGVCDGGTCTVVAKPDDTSCTTADLCVQTAHCESGGCIADTVLDCSDLDGPCTIGVCSRTGCVQQNKPDDTDCSDDDLCTVGDRCVTGQCTPTGPKDCSNLDGECVTGVCGNDGECTTEDKDDDIDCSDGDPCTVGDRCVSGNCQPLGPKNCSAFTDECNTGVCNASGECIADPKPDLSACDDGNECTLEDYCQSGVCNGSTGSVDCSDGVICTDDVCNPVDGSCTNPVSAGYCHIGEQCVGSNTENPQVQCEWCDPDQSQSDWSDKPEQTACNDENACTLGDYCQSGQCDGSTGAVDCSDGLGCTQDICNPINAACTNPIDSNYCVISNDCVPADTSNSLQPDCQFCDPQNDQTEWSARADQTPCTDDDACTTVTYCEDGLCTGVSARVDCSDDLGCTDDVCNPADGQCSNPLIGGYCLIGGVCHGASVTNPAQPMCAICNPQIATESWTPVNEGMDCSANACHLNDQCNQGVCEFTQKVCPDSPSFPCWLPVCSAATGNCSYNVYGREGQSCDPQNVCVENATCSSGNCTGDAYDCTEYDDACHTGVCADDNGSPVCTVDTVQTGAFCDDGEAGTVNDACNESELCVGESLPLVTDGTTGELTIRLSEASSGAASPLCAQLNIATTNPEGLLVMLTSPAATVVTLHDHAAGTDPLILDVETSDFAIQDRLGDWLFTFIVDNPAEAAQVNAVGITFGACPSEIMLFEDESELE